MSFYDNNELIAYPLLGTDAGLPHDLLVDCIVHAPSSLGSQLQLLSISVTDLVVSCVLGIGGTPVAYLTLPQSAVETHVGIELTSIVPSVSGFIAFGEGIRRQRLRMDGPFPFMEASLISFEYDVTDPTISAGGHDWFGLVNLDVGDGLTIAARSMRIRKEDTSIVTVTAAVIGVSNENYLVDPLSACCIPADGPAKVQPVVSVNEVQPDCSGNLDIVVVIAKELPTEPDITLVASPGQLLFTDNGEPCAS